MRLELLTVSTISALSPSTLEVDVNPYKVITNEGDQNRVIAASINSDGTLVCLRTRLHGYSVLSVASRASIARSVREVAGVTE